MRETHLSICHFGLLVFLDDDMSISYFLNNSQKYRHAEQHLAYPAKEKIHCIFTPKPRFNS